MFILYFILWVIFNGQITLEISLFGIAIAAGIYAFTCIFMDFSLKKDIALCKRIFLFLHYIFVLIWEIIKANIVMVKFIVVKQERELHPVIFKMKTKLNSKVARTLLANSITLTPGTITVSMKDDELIIHAIDESLAIEDDGNFIFEELLYRMENISCERKTAKNNAESNKEDAKAGEEAVKND